MIRPRTALTATLLAAVTAAGTVAVAGASSGDEPPLTYADATKARAAALAHLPGRAVSIDRDDDGGQASYEVSVLTARNQAREVELDERFRVVRTRREGADGLTHRAAGRAERAALARVPGIVVDLDAERGRTRYEVDVLTRAGAERVVRLSADFAVLRVTDAAADDDDRGRDDDHDDADDRDDD